MTIVYHPEYENHIQSPGHPECPERLESIRLALGEANLWKDVLIPKAAEEEKVLAVHEEAYLDLLKSGVEGYLDPDTYVRPETYDIALLAAGGGLLAAQRAYETGREAFAFLRPPGHHAIAYRQMGFCYLNNVAIAAQRHAARGKKVAIVDIDVHHGNGTQDIFYNRGDVLYVSTHQSGIFPGTGGLREVGIDDGEGFTVNLPFQSGTGDSSFAAGFERIVEPVVRQFEPDLLLCSIGTDSHYRDPLAGLNLSTNGYLDCASRLRGLASELCGGGLAYFLEGGYDLQAIADVMTGMVAQAGNVEYEPRFVDEYDSETWASETLDEVVKVQSEHWKL